MTRKLNRGQAAFAAVLASGVFVFSTPVQSDEIQGAHPAPPSHSTPPERRVSSYHPLGVPDSAKYYFQSVWGIDNLLVRQTASGNLIRFSYRVTDPARAKALGDKKATPYMVGQRSRAVLQVPVMDKVGQLRQSAEPEAGKEYWMVFSNKGRLVNVGDRVNVIIGSFHADGLTVK